MGVTAPPLTALLAMGTFGRPHGVRGELTFWPDDGHPTPEGSPLGWGSIWVEGATGLRQLRIDKARSAGDHWLVTLAEIGSREAAAQLTKLRVLVLRSVLPPLAEGEFYVADTVGLEVRDQDGANLGRVVSTFWNGAQDVAIVKNQAGEETLLPLVDAVVQRVNLEKKLLEVLWEVDESLDPARDGAMSEPDTGSSEPISGPVSEPASEPSSEPVCEPPSSEALSAPVTDTAAASSVAPRVASAITFEVVTLFPGLFQGFLQTSLFGKAILDGLLRVHFTDLRPFGLGKQQSVDDTPYGGGPGMVLRPEPIAAALESIDTARGPSTRVLLTPSGKLLDQRLVRQLASSPRLTFVCGRYEGFDQRVSALVQHEVSIGEYVLAGGELAAAVIMEAVARLVPGVLGCGQSVDEESFAAAGRLEHPQWTKPPLFREFAVPEALLSGDHAAIARFRRLTALQRTQAMRPDLVARHPFDEDEQRLLAGLPPRRKKR